MNEWVNVSSRRFSPSISFPTITLPTASLVPWTLLADGNSEVQIVTVSDFGKKGHLQQVKKKSHLPQVAYSYLGLLISQLQLLLHWPKLASYLCQHLLHTSFKDSLSGCLLIGATCIFGTQRRKQRNITWTSTMCQLFYKEVLCNHCYHPSRRRQFCTPAPILQMVKWKLREESSAEGHTFITRGDGPGPRFSKPQYFFSRTL